MKKVKIISIHFQMNFPTKKRLLISQQPMNIGFFNDLLTSGTSISPELILSMMSWGGDLSMEHPTDWAVPTKSKRKIILKCTCFLVNINFMCQGIKLYENWYIWTPNQGLKLIFFFVICCQQFTRFILKESVLPIGFLPKNNMECKKHSQIHHHT